MSSKLQQMEKAGVRYMIWSLIVIGIHLFSFITLYLLLPPVIEYRDDLKPGTQTGSKQMMIWIELAFVAVFGILLWSQRQQKAMKFNWPVNEANRDNLIIAGRWMWRRLLFCITILLTVMMTGGMLNTLGIVPSMAVNVAVPVWVVVTVVLLFHSLIRLQDVNAGRIK